MPLTKAPKRRLKKGANAKAPAKPALPSSSPQLQSVPHELQQQLLDIFKEACSDSLNDSLTGTVQEIKQCLFHRDFAGAFGSPAHLEVYAARWSPTRALTYLEIFCHSPAISGRFAEIRLAEVEECDLTKTTKELSLGSKDPVASKAASSKFEVVCLGAGGGAELVAFAGTMHHINTQTIADRPANYLRDASNPSLHCTFVDIADWEPVLSKLHAAERTGATALDNSRIVTEPFARQYTSTILKQDVLNISQDELTTLAHASLVTIMFTLNELYSTSIGSTTKMLLTLTSVLQPGALLLVVDSPGSYSTVSFTKSGDPDGSPNNATKQEKQYPMQWLLDHTLLETATVSDSRKISHKQWEKIESQESKWFRLSSELKYPIDLEDMRYQMHLYKRL